MTRYDADDLFFADSLCMNAGSNLIRAVTAGEHGRYPEQRALVEKAVADLADALSRLSGATAPATRPQAMADCFPHLGQGRGV